VTKRLRTIPQALWERTPNNVYRTDLTTERFTELKLLAQNAVEFKAICRINYGAQISSKEKGGFKRAEHLSKRKADMVAAKRFYEGSNMRPYGMRWDGMYVDMGRRDEMYGPRTPAFFENDKLSVRHISGDADTFVAWVDEERYYTDHGVIHAVPWHALKGEKDGEAAYGVTEEQEAVSLRYPLFYLLGVLMSRPARELYAELYATGSLQGAFSHVYPDMVKGLPIPKVAKAPGEAPANWFAKLAAQAPSGRHSRASVRRAFPSRDKLVAALTAAARRRQELELHRDTRSKDFLDFMQIHSPHWRWRRGESLDDPPDETQFLTSVGKDLVSLDTMKAVRTEFSAATDAAAVDRTEARALQAMMDALVAALYASKA
jgi:hypothetical protein